MEICDQYQVLPVRFLLTKGARGRREEVRWTCFFLSASFRSSICFSLCSTPQAMLIVVESQILRPARQQHPSSSPWDTPLPWTPARREKFQASGIPPETCEVASINSNCPSLTGFPRVQVMISPCSSFYPSPGCHLGIPLPCLWSFQASRNFPC